MRCITYAHYGIPRWRLYFYAENTVPASNRFTIYYWNLYVSRATSPTTPINIRPRHLDFTVRLNANLFNNECLLTFPRPSVGKSLDNFHQPPGQTPPSLPEYIRLIDRTIVLYLSTQSYFRSLAIDHFLRSSAQLTTSSNGYTVSETFRLFFGHDLFFNAHIVSRYYVSEPRR